MGWNKSNLAANSTIPLTDNVFNCTVWHWLRSRLLTC